MITTEDKLKCVKRELALRVNVYPRRIKDGKMTELNAARELEVMAAIARDYEERLRNEARA